MTPEEKLKELGYELTEIPVGNAPLVPWVLSGNHLYCSGRVSELNGQPLLGQVGGEVSTDDAYRSAREIAVGQLSVAKTALGDLSRIKRVVKVLGMVNCAPGYGDQPKVINGFSELFVEVFGENGRHARSAVGMAGLPGNHAVEIEVIFEVE